MVYNADRWNVFYNGESDDEVLIFFNNYYLSDYIIVCYIFNLIICFSIDATDIESCNGHINYGHFINHSFHENLTPKLIIVNDEPNLLFIARNDIRIGEEIVYDYSDKKYRIHKRLHMVKKN